MIYRCDDVELELAVRRGLEDSGIDLDLLDPRTVKFLQCSDYTSLFACTGGAIDEEMREVSALSLNEISERRRTLSAGVLVLLTSDFNLAERS